MRCHVVTLAMNRQALPNGPYFKEDEPFLIAIDATVYDIIIYFMIMSITSIDRWQKRMSAIVSCDPMNI